MTEDTQTSLDDVDTQAAEEPSGGGLDDSTSAPNANADTDDVVDEGPAGDPDPDANADTDDVVDEGPAGDPDPDADDLVDEVAAADPDESALTDEGTELDAGAVDGESRKSTRGGGDRLKQLEAEGDIAADYLEELLDIADLDGDLDMDVEGDRAAVSIVGSDLGALVGDDGQVLESLQELTRLAVYRETGERSRLMLDIGGYRADVRTNLVALAEEAIEEVRETGEAVKLAPMTPFERKVVHDAVAGGGLQSESEGVEPTRCVVILPVS